MRLIPNSTALRRTAMASARSAGSPHTPRPVSCIAPNPSRWTGSSPLIATVPLLAAGAALATGGCFFLPALSRMCCSFFLSAVIGPPFALDSGGSAGFNILSCFSLILEAAGAASESALRVLPHPFDYTRVVVAVREVVIEGREAVLLTSLLHIHGRT